MTNINRYLFAMFGMLFFAGVAQARVCFLPGGEDEAEFCLDSVPYFENALCPNMVPCAHPKKGANVCIESDGSQRYDDTSQCCEDSSEYEICPDGSKCESGYACIADGYESCKKGHCQCPDYYEVCDTDHGQIGVGDSCKDGDGVKYAECRCTDEYHICDSNAVGSGSSCTDDRGTLYTHCSCPSDWSTSRDGCLCGAADECTNYPNGSKVYSCRANGMPDCVCGYTYNASYSGCADGCTDDEYEFVGSIPPAYICEDTISGLKGVCGKNCKCAPQNWDTDCSYPDCASIGYTARTCPGDWLSCPYDSSKKKCLGGGN